MVRGLFPRAEHDVVIATLERSIVFLTSANFEQLLTERSLLIRAWTLANLYLASLGALLLAAKAPRLVGLSEETTCFVSIEYFADDDPFGDFIIHEAAHIFQNCKRTTLAPRDTRQAVAARHRVPKKRETFAYSCEAYARVSERRHVRRLPPCVCFQCMPSRESERCATTRWKGRGRFQSMTKDAQLAHKPLCLNTRPKGCVCSLPETHRLILPPDQSSDPTCKRHRIACVHTTRRVLLDCSQLPHCISIEIGQPIACAVTVRSALAFAVRSR
jgi:hypothetical protein